MGKRLKSSVNQNAENYLHFKDLPKTNVERLNMLQKQTLEVIKSTVPLLEEHGCTITDVFYKDLLTNHPYLKNIFNMANQGKGDQSRALSNAVLAYAKNIDNLEVLLPALKRIAHKHVSLDIRPKQYDVVGEALLAAIQEVLSLPNDHVALTAWGEAYGILADVFINVEADIYTENEKKEGGWQGFRDFYIDKIEEETPEVKSFYFKPIDLGEIPDFKAGQYVGVQVRPNDSDTFQVRQYSLSQKGDLRISVKAEPEGMVSSHLHQCKESEVVSIQAPTGVFTLANQLTKKIFIAGGVGITPLFSMMQEAIANDTRAENILFIQCVRDEEHQIFQNDLSKLKAVHNFKHKLCFENSNLGDHQGYLNQEIIKTWASDLGFSSEETEVYFCGPKPFMAVLKGFFVELGYSEKNIHYEVFGPTTGI